MVVDGDLNPDEDEACPLVVKRGWSYIYLDDALRAAIRLASDLLSALPLEMLEAICVDGVIQITRDGKIQTSEINHN